MFQATSRGGKANPWLSEQGCCYRNGFHREWQGVHAVFPAPDLQANANRVSTGAWANYVTPNSCQRLPDHPAIRTTVQSRMQGI